MLRSHKGKSRILTLVSRDLVAAEGHYHSSCYRNYYSRYLNTAKSVSTEEGTDHDAVALEKSYTELFHFIRTDLFVTPRVMTMVELFSRLAASMHACGIDTIEDSVKKHIHRTLEREFYSSLHIYRDNEGKLFVFPDNLTMCELTKENLSLRSHLCQLKSLTSEDIVSKTALKLRDDIQKQEISKDWPPQLGPEIEESIIPQSVHLFFNHLLTGNLATDRHPRKLNGLS